MDVKAVLATIKKGDSQMLDSLLSENLVSHWNSQDLIRIAQCLRDNGLLTRAIELVADFRQEHKVKDSMKLVYLRGELLFDAERYAESIEAYTEALHAKETDIAFNNRGMAYLALGNDNYAMCDFRSALSINPDNPTSLRGAGEILLGQKQYTDAAFHFRRAIEQAPHYEDAIIGLGETYLQNGDGPKAYECYVKLLEIDPANDFAQQRVRQLEKYFGLE